MSLGIREVICLKGKWKIHLKIERIWWIEGRQGEKLWKFFFFFCRNYRTVEKEESAGHIRMYEVEMTLGKTVDIFLNGE